MVRELHRVKGSDIQTHQLENEGGYRITNVSKSVIVSLLSIATVVVMMMMMMMIMMFIN